MPLTINKSRLLIVDPSTDSRMKIKAVATGYMKIKRMTQSQNVRAALEKLENSDGFDFIFVSSRIGTSTISKFIEDARSLPKTEKTAFILLLESKHQDSSYIVNNIMGGVDGFVFEPLSVDTFIEVVKTARDKVKDGPVEMDQIAKKKLMSFLLSDAIHQIDICSSNLAVGKSPGYALKHLKESSNRLKKLAEAEFEAYTEVAIGSFSNVPVPKKIKNKISRPKKPKKKEDKKEGEKGAGYFIRKR